MQTQLSTNELYFLIFEKQEPLVLERSTFWETRLVQIHLKMNDPYSKPVLYKIKQSLPFRNRFCTKSPKKC